MDRRRSPNPWLVAAIVVASAAAVGVGIWAFLRWLRKPLAPVPRLDLDRFSGSWHTIAALPAAGRRFEPGSALRIRHDGGGDLQIAHLTRGATSPRSAVATAADAGARLKVRGGGPLGRELVVLAVTPTYDACVVGSPDRRRAWILSRKTEIERPVWRHFRDELVRQGFSAERLRQAPGTRVRTDAFGSHRVADRVDEALDETFPASDPPASWAGPPEGGVETPPDAPTNGVPGSSGEA
jgi:apolipoprotein D and lipocalin family protein